MFPGSAKKPLPQKPAPKAYQEDASLLAFMNPVKNAGDYDQKDTIHRKDIEIGRLMKKQ
jgi:hypothetical protein